MAKSPNVEDVFRERERFFLRTFCIPHRPYSTLVRALFNFMSRGTANSTNCRFKFPRKKETFNEKKLSALSILSRFALWPQLPRNVYSLADHLHTWNLCIWRCQQPKRSWLRLWLRVCFLYDFSSSPCVA